MSLRQKHKIESARQRSVNIKGRKLETNVKQILNTILSSKRIRALDCSKIRKWARIDSNYKGLAEYIKVSIESPCSKETITYLPDKDIIVFCEQERNAGGGVTRHPLCVVSCQTSFHARGTEPLFWSLLTRSKVRYVLVTEDSDRYGERPKTELGTCTNGNKIRRLFESFLERAYIIKKYDRVNDGLVKDIDSFCRVFGKDVATRKGIEPIIFDDNKRKPRAGYCTNIRPFDDLLFDIIRWKSEISAFGFP
jgi:hypothetical protein